MTRASSGVMVAHLTPTCSRWMAFVIIQIHVEVRQDQTVLDVFPDDTGHLVAVEFDDFAFDLDFGHGLSSLSELKVMGSVLLHVC